MRDSRTPTTACSGVGPCVSDTDWPKKVRGGPPGSSAITRWEALEVESVSRRSIFEGTTDFKMGAAELSRKQRLSNQLLGERRGGIRPGECESPYCLMNWASAVRRWEFPSAEGPREVGQHLRVRWDGDRLGLVANPARGTGARDLPLK